jgi:hypothetical protein
MQLARPMRHVRPSPTLPPSPDAPAAPAGPRRRITERELPLATSRAGRRPSPDGVVAPLRCPPRRHHLNTAIHMHAAARMQAPAPRFWGCRPVTSRIRRRARRARGRRRARDRGPACAVAVSAREARERRRRRRGSAANRHPSPYASSSGPGRQVAPPPLLIGLLYGPEYGGGRRRRRTLPLRLRLRVRARVRVRVARAPPQLINAYGPPRSSAR